MKKLLTVVVALLLIPCLSFAQEINIDFSNLSDEDLQLFIDEADAAIKTILDARHEAQYYLLKPDDLPSNENKSEILFRNIPWGSTVEEVLAFLTDQGVASPKQKVKKEDYIYSWRTDFDDVGSALLSKAGDSISIYSFADDFNVAGHKLSSLHIYCPYTFANNVVNYSETNFFNAEMSFEYVDGTAVKYDLISKLESIYGESKSSSDSAGYWSTDGNYTEYMTWNIWEGANDTGICLYHEQQVSDSDGKVQYEELKLLYSKTNGQQYLDALSYAMKNDAAVEEQQKIQDLFQNSNGL